MQLKLVKKPLGPLRLFHQITVTQEAVQESAHLCNEWQTEIV